MNSATFVRQSLAQRGPQRGRRRSKSRIERAGERLNRVVGTLTDKIMPQRQGNGNDDESKKPSENRVSLNRALTAVADKLRREKRIGANLQGPLQSAIDNGWDARYQSRYREVHVFLTYWDDGNPYYYATEAARQLRSLFEDKYGFNVVPYPIPVSTIDPAATVAYLLEQFMDQHGAKGNLLIFWYGGAARMSRDGRGRTMWFGEDRGRLISSGLVLKTLSGMLEAPPCEADILTLFDCQHSINDMPTSLGQGIFEHLGATANVDFAPWEYKGCFTKALIDILSRDESARYGISIPDLHRQLVENAVSVRRDIAEQNARWTHDNPGAQSFETHAFITTPPPPVYCHVSPVPRRSKNASGSIVLSRLNQRLEYFSVSPDNEELKVELIVSSNNHRLDMASWSNWLQNAPPQVEKIEIRRITG
ncbi:hypothetical protein E8E14_012709 [Neopestalotiopsis sp. 37M]|nr:hypothetical protein E8E14_012709 [Neopestalotiopsis sp. 37M]